MQRAQALDAELDNVYAKLYDERKRCRELDGKVDELEAQNRALKKRDEQLESSVESGYGWAEQFREKLRKEKKRGEMLEQVLEAEGIDVEVALSDMMKKNADQAQSLGLRKQQQKSLGSVVAKHKPSYDGDEVEGEDVDVLDAEEENVIDSDDDELFLASFARKKH